MGFGKCCVSADEGKRAEIEHLMQRGRRLHARAVYGAFARAIVGAGECLGEAWRRLTAGCRKPKRG